MTGLEEGDVGTLASRSPTSLEKVLPLRSVGSLLLSSPLFLQRNRVSECVGIASSEKTLYGP